MLALTAKAAKRWKLKHTALPAVETGAWVVDLLKLARGPLLVLIVHQDSLFTLVRPATAVKTLACVDEEIARIWPGHPGDDAVVCRNGNRRVTGSILDMKHALRVYLRFEDLAAAEYKINDTPFSAIDMDYPRARFQRLREVEDELNHPRHR